MNITIQIPDTAYKQLIKGNSRLQGSIGLISPTEGNFNVHQRNRNHSQREYYKLPHGRVSVGNNNVRFNLTINLDERGIIASDAIIYESHDASDFVDCILEKEGRL